MSRETLEGLRVSDLHLSFGGEQILTGLDLEVTRGKSASIMGRSGCGKSTLLACVAGLLTPSRGTIEVAGTRVDRLSRAAAARFRGEKVGIVFQSGELLPEVSALENVVLPGVLAGAGLTATTDRATELLSAFDVRSASTLTRHLSGGEQARVAVARALIGNPVMILADEPTGSLDADLRRDMQALLYALPEQHGCALLVVTHDPVVAAGADAEYRMVQGGLERVRR
jgi:lipoprotein-releasing system ATP-binding protein